MGVGASGRPAGTAMALLLSRDRARGGAVAVARAQVTAPSGTPPAGGVPLPPQWRRAAPAAVRRAAPAAVRRAAAAAVAAVGRHGGRQRPIKSDRTGTPGKQCGDN